MDTTITATELARNLSDILNRVRYRGEKFRVLRAGEVVATLGPEALPGRLSSREFVELLREVPAPDDGFLEDLRVVRAAQGQLPPSPWES